MAFENKTCAMTVSMRHGMGLYDRKENSEETVERFVRVAELLPEGNVLGLQIEAKENGVNHIAAFSSGLATVSMDDFNWIFQKCATAEKASILHDIDSGGRKVYALKSKSDGFSSVENSDQGRRPEYGHRPGYDGDDDFLDLTHLKNLMEAAKATRMIIQIIVKYDGRGSVLISLPDEITLRMQAMLSLAFSDTVTIEVDDETMLSMDLLPRKIMMESLSGMLNYLMLDEEMINERDLGDLCDSVLTECGDETLSEILTIEDMDLSVRSTNCLKRAGINNIEELCAMSEDDLLNVRNLGRKCVEEIKDKLSSLGDYSLAKTELSQRVSGEEQLNELIGLEEAKEQARRITAIARLKKDIGANELPICLNMEFVGNPGTAKTTVARIMASIFYEIGLLPSAELMEIGRADLIARYEGQTADKVKSVFKQAKGKVLFIDEAYSLVESVRGEYGDEAINTIVQEMENNRDGTIVIFAGYPGKMDELFSCNPGLRSRVPFKVTFSDYSPEEMIKIAELESRKRGFSISREAYSRVRQLCEMAAYNAELGNGRFCRNLIEDAVISYATRVYGDKGEAKEKDMTLISDDFLIPSALQSVKKKNSIGFAF